MKYNNIDKLIKKCNKWKNSKPSKKYRTIPKNLKNKVVAENYDGTPSLTLYDVISAELNSYSGKINRP